jgi:hypothetical protein
MWCKRASDHHRAPYGDRRSGLVEVREPDAATRASGASGGVRGASRRCCRGWDWVVLRGLGEEVGRFQPILIGDHNGLVLLEDGERLCRARQDRVRANVRWGERWADEVNPLEDERCSVEVLKNKDM